MSMVWLVFMKCYKLSWLGHHLDHLQESIPKQPSHRIFNKLRRNLRVKFGCDCAMYLLLEQVQE